LVVSYALWTVYESTLTAAARFLTSSPLMWTVGGWGWVGLGRTVDERGPYWDDFRTALLSSNLGPRRGSRGGRLSRTAPCFQATFRRPKLGERCSPILPSACTAARGLARSMT